MLKLKIRKLQGVTWLPNQDQNGTGDSGKRISRTWVGDMRTISDFVKTKYDYDPDSMRTSIISKVIIGS